MTNISNSLTTIHDLTSCKLLETTHITQSECLLKSDPALNSINETWFKSDVTEMMNNEKVTFKSAIIYLVTQNNL